MKGIIIFIVILGLGVALYFLFRWLYQWNKTESLNAANREITYMKIDENYLGKFDYTREEWKYLYDIEFEIYRNAKSIWTASAIEIYENNEVYDRNQIPGTIYFLPDQIIVNNGHCSKKYRFNNLNFTGFGAIIQWTHLEDSSFMKTLQMKIKINTNEGNFFEDYNILIPSSANHKINEIVNQYYS